MPEWINYWIRNKVLFFDGTPTENDIGKYIVRIFDTSGFVVRQFRIEVCFDNDKKMKAKKISYSRDMFDTSTSIEMSSSPTYLLKKDFKDKFEEKNETKRMDTINEEASYRNENSNDNITNDDKKKFTKTYLNDIANRKRNIIELPSLIKTQRNEENKLIKEVTIQQTSDGVRIDQINEDNNNNNYMNEINRNTMIVDVEREKENNNLMENNEIKFESKGETSQNKENIQEITIINMDEKKIDTPNKEKEEKHYKEEKYYKEEKNEITDMLAEINKTIAREMRKSKLLVLMKNIWKKKK